MKKLIFRHGVMNCGKSTLLLQVAHNYEEKGKKVIVMKLLCDTKGISRLGISRKVDYLIDDVTDFENYLFNISLDGIDCILVDESQFLNNDHISLLYYFTKKYDIPVIYYGLRSDFRGMLFQGSEALFAYAETIEELITICSCGRKARFNSRIVNNEYVYEGNQVIIDGDNNVNYESMCGVCYLKKVLKKDLG